MRSKLKHGAAAREVTHTGAQRRFGFVFDLHVVEGGGEALERLFRFFQRDRDGQIVGMVEVLL